MVVARPPLPLPLLPPLENSPVHNGPYIRYIFTLSGNSIHSPLTPLVYYRTPPTLVFLVAPPLLLPSTPVPLYPCVVANCCERATDHQRLFDEDGGRR